MKKRFASILMSLALLGTGCLSGLDIAFADTEVPEEASIQTEYFRNPETGYIYPAEEMEVPVSTSATTNEEGRNKAMLPSLYPSGDVTQIINTYPATRSQSPYGTCWAHAAVACGEFDFVKNHGYTASIDLSELQLAYFTYHTANDKLGNLDDDANYIPANAAEQYLDIGGNATYVMQTLSQWKGLTYENNLSYSNAVNSLSYGIPSSYAYANDGAKLENAFILNIKENPTAVKEAIQTYGAVQASYYHDSQYYSQNIYDLYYCPDGSLGTNHDIAIVGWNDNLPASAFPSWNQPSRNGGWLIRNSWSTTAKGSEYSYFWMSYDDKSLARNAYAFDYVPGNKWANLYQHDGTSGYGGINIEKAANVFTAKNPDGAGSEVLQGVMLCFMQNTDVQYQIDIYTGLSGGIVTNPESGYHHGYATTTGMTTHAGIHTVYLKQPVYLAPGEKYAIVVTSKSGQVTFATEYTHNYTYKENGITMGWFNTVGTADPGESLYASYNGWTDAATDPLTANGNFKIKGLTNNSSEKKYLVTYNLNGGTVEAGNPDWYFSTSGSTTLKTPTRDGYHFLGWYTDSNYTNQITAISGSLGSNLTLYAKWEAHNYNQDVQKKATAKEQGIMREQCTGCGISQDYYILIPSIKLSYAKTTYDGYSKKPQVTVFTENGALSSGLYNVTYKKNIKVGRGEVIVRMDERYYDVTLNKKFSIVPKAPASVTAKLSGDYNNVKVTWKKSVGADGYYVYYKKASASKYLTKNRIATTKLTKIFKNLNNGVKYNFKVVPYFKSGKTKYTSIKYKTATATTLKQLKVPSMSRVSGGKVSLKWQSISGASGYQVYWASKQKGKYKKLCDYSNKYGGVTFSVGKGEAYWYKVRAYKKVNGKKIYGPWSKAKKYIR